MVEKGITNVDSSDPDCIPVVVLKNSEPGLSYTAERFNKSLREFSFPHSWKVSLVVPVWKKVYS